MKTFKYYRVKKSERLPQLDSIDIYDYAEDNGDKIVGVNATNHTEFETTVTATAKTFAEVQDYLTNSHLNKQLNQQIVNRIRKKYSVNDEIALMKKADTDVSKIAYNDYVAAIKISVNVKKKEYGIKQ